jgi:hypothetical protein
MGIWTATREDVKASLEVSETMASNRLIDRRLDASTRAVEGILKRRFYPQRKTVTWNYPHYQYGPSYKLYLDGNDMVSVESVVSGGVTLSPADYFLSRDDGLDEPPYDSLELDTSSDAVFAAGDSFQRAISVTGVFGWNDTDTSIPHALLGGNINSSVTTLVLNPASGIYDIGVGSQVLIGTERVITTDRRMSDSGINTTADSDDVKSDRILSVGNGSAFAVGEIILVDAERMRVDDIAGNNLIVTRAFDGTTLDTHTTGADVYAARTFTVQRGALGSTAASHTLNDNSYAHDWHPLVRELTTAIAVVLLEQNAAAYTSEMGSGESARDTPGVGLPSLIATAREAVGRVSRSDAI